ncbi:MAG: molybdate ABC transporter substrate-binding protein [Myxococcota bacterium]
MRIPRWLRALALGVVPCLVLAAAAPRRVELTVSAAASLRDVLTEVARAYQAQAPDVVLTFNFGASGALQHQVEQGAPVDVFISAAKQQLDALEDRGLLLQGTRAVLARNELVVISAKDSALQLSDLVTTEVRRVALGEPGSVPAGTYAREALTSLGMWDALRTKLVYAKDVRQVLTYVESGNVEAGLVYATDARSSARVRVVTTLPAGSHAPIVYPVAAVRATRNPDEARRFIQFLQGPATRGILVHHGFLPPTP